jgi:hypothetical protein
MEGPLSSITEAYLNNLNLTANLVAIVEKRKEEMAEEGVSAILAIVSTCNTHPLGLYADS